MLSHQPEEVGEGDSRELGGLAVPQPAASNLLQEPEDPHLVGNLGGFHDRCWNASSEILT